MVEVIPRKHKKRCLAEPAWTMTMWLRGCSAHGDLWIPAETQVPWRIGVAKKRFCSLHRPDEPIPNPLPGWLLLLGCFITWLAGGYHSIENTCRPTSPQRLLLVLTTLVVIIFPVINHSHGMSWICMIYMDGNYTIPFYGSLLIFIN